MMTALVFVLAQGLIVDGNRYHYNAEGVLLVTRAADDQRRYAWWPDPPGVPLIGRLATGEVAIRNRKTKVVAAGFGSANGLFALDISKPDRNRPSVLRLLLDDPVTGQIEKPLVMAMIGRPARPFVIGGAGVGAFRPGLLMVSLDSEDRHVLEVSSPGATLGAVGVARHIDGRVIYAYAGDTKGRLWRFDLSGDRPWLQPKLRTPVFTATRSDGTPQAIDIAPAVMHGPNGGYLLGFGTSAAGSNTLYAFHDRLGKPVNHGRADLVRRTARPEGDGLRIEGRPVDYESSSGWHLDLACGDGERMAGLDASGGVLIASTTLDADDDTHADGCTYALLPLSGLPPDQTLTGKRTANVADGIAELIAIGPVQSVDSGQGRTTHIANFQLARRDADGKLHVLQNIRTERRYGRLSWRELPHWRSLHQATKRRAP